MRKLSSLTIETLNQYVTGRRGMRPRENISDKESLERAKELGERTLDQQVATVREKGKMAIELIKINLLIASVIFGILKLNGSVLLSSDDVQGFLLAYLPLLISIIILIFVRMISNSTYGLGSNGIDTFRELEEEKGLEGLVEAYVHFISGNEVKIKRLNYLLVVSVLITISAISYLAIGFLSVAK